MGGVTFRTWEDIPANYLEAQRLKIPKKRRPSFLVVEVVGRFIAQTIKNNKGYSDEAYSQMVQRLHGAVSMEQVQAAIRVLVPAVYERIKGPTRGENGRGGRAAQYAFNPALDMMTAPFREVANPTPIRTESVGDETPVGMGFEPAGGGIAAESLGDASESVGGWSQPSHRSSNMSIQYSGAPIDGSNRATAKKLINDRSEPQIRIQREPRQRSGVVTLDEAIFSVLGSARAVRDQTHTRSGLDEDLPF